MEILLILGIVYVVFSYLYMLGYILGKSGSGYYFLSKKGCALVVALSPITLPVALGSQRSQD